MVNTIRFYDEGWNLRLAQTIGSASQIGGVHYDGHHYWITDQTGVTGSIRGYVFENGAFQVFATVALPTGYSAPTGITGDGHNLYVACTHTDAGPPVSVTRQILIYNKTPLAIRQLGGIGYPTSVVIRDLDFDGSRLVIIVTGTTTPTGQIYLHDLATELTDYQSAGFVREPHAVTFNGHSFPAGVLVAGNYFGVHVDHSPQILTGATALPGEPYGCTMVRDWLGDEDVVESGEGVAMAFRA